MKKPTPEQVLVREICGLLHDLQAIDEEARNHPKSIERNRPGRFLIEQRLAEKRRQLKHMNARHNLREHSFADSMASDFTRLATPTERIVNTAVNALGTAIAVAVVVALILAGLGALR